MFAEENGLKGDPRLRVISESIRVIPNFPKPGIMFQDISTLLLNPKAFKYTVDIFVDRYKDMDISAVAGCEARGFIFGPPIALAIGAKFVPLRKPGKLPGETISEAYDLEYGNDCLEMHVGAVQKGDRVLIIDDLVATGGTLSASIRLIERMEADVIECACVVGLTKFKKDRKLNGKPLYILIEPRLEIACSKTIKNKFDRKNGTKDELHCMNGTKDELHCMNGAKDELHCMNGAKDELHCMNGSSGKDGTTSVNRSGNVTNGRV